MATPLTDSINALTQYANETTGKSDTTLSDAVGSLVEGYGGGISAFKTKTVTVPYEIYQNAETMANWLSTVVPQSIFAIIVRDELFTNMAKGGGTLMEAIFENNSPLLYQRYFSSKVQNNNAWLSSYYLSADEGDKYIIFYQE